MPIALAVALWSAALVAWVLVGRTLGAPHATRPAGERRLARKAGLLVVLAGFCAVAPARAQSASVPAAAVEVTLEEALALFADHNLDLRLARARAAEAAGLAAQASAYPNPTASAAFDPLFGDTDGFAYEASAGLSQMLVWPDLRNARIQSAREHAAAAVARARADSLRLAFEVVQAYVGAAAAQERADRLGDVARVVRQATAAADERYAEGDMAGFDLHRLRVEQARYETALELARLEAASARRQLALLILPGSALTDAAEAAPAGGLDRLPPAVLLADALAAASRLRPEAAAARTEVEAVRSALRAARLSRRPSPTVSAGVQRQQGGFYGPTLGLSLPLPVFDRNAGKIAAEQARLDQAETRLDLVERRIAADVRSAYETYASLGRRTALVRGELLSGTEGLLATARLAYAEGALSLVELLDAADAYREARVVSAELLAGYTVAYYDLLRSAGGAFDSSPTPTP